MYPVVAYVLQPLWGTRKPKQMDSDDNEFYALYNSYPSFL